MSSTEISVEWTSYNDNNSSVTSYEVKYIPIFSDETRSFPLTINTRSTETLFRLTGLMKFTQYEISVRAHTENGPGDYSEVVQVKTNEDGNRTSIIIRVSSRNFCLGEGGICTFRQKYILHVNNSLSTVNVFRGKLGEGELSNPRGGESFTSLR